MRVITGTARGRKLESPPDSSVRPTSERAKEALFSALQFELENARVLDLFAGSGQLGIEALSRGAGSCVFVDASRESFELCKRNVAHCELMQHARVAQMDALAFLRGSRDTFDIALLDPPYRAGLWEELLPLLAPRMSDSGVIVCETPVRDVVLPETFGDFRAVKTYKHGIALLTFYRKELDA